MTIDEIREIIQLAVSSGIAELEVERGEDRIRIRTAAGVVTLHAAPSHSVAPPPAAPAPGATQSPAPAPPAPDLTDPALVPVKSPIVGTFYEAPGPGAAPFVKVGESIETGRILCIIESMKLMNEIESEVGGTIVKRLVENGQPVEYGETLFLVKPD
jgi:acetyl-CoA carboxylase biotin carboxyl carrier protein